MKSKSTTFYRYLPVSSRDEKWGLYATTVGESHIAPDTAYPPSGHPEGYAFDWQHGRVLDGFQLVYISSGRGRLEWRPDFSVTIEPGHVFLLLPGMWHRYAPEPESGWHEHWIGFDGEMARRWLEHQFVSAQHPVLRLQAEGAVLAVFSRVMQAVRANPPALQQLLAGATADLLGQFYSTLQTPPTAAATQGHAVERAITRIQEEFASQLDMPCLARELGVSYSGFRSTFAAHTGLSPHQYLLELRLARARNLLDETAFSVKEIAMRTGFTDEHYFSRLFRRKLKLTPSDWRKRRRES
jgi:AraC-like DNA-binding protein